MKDNFVQDIFSECAKKFKDNIAIILGNKKMTYDELENESNRIANYIVSKCHHKKPNIAVISNNSIDVIKTMIGILKAGSVFVPVEPALPQNRIDILLKEIDPELIFTDKKSIQAINDLVQQKSYSERIICSENGDGYHDFNNLPGNHDHTIPPVVIKDLDDMCYIYFTSGSTGKPKGIAGRIKSIAHFIQWEIKTLNIIEGTRVSQLMTPSFDAFLRDIFVPLCSGGTICIPEDEDTKYNPGKLINFIEENEINLVHCVPSLFRSILKEDLNPNGFPELNYILMAGETLLPSDIKTWTDIYDDRIKLVNLYGQSETTMAKFCYFISPEDANRPSIPIGKPIEGSAAVIVDSSGNICPSGEVGEIYIRTPYRTLGYYKSPELTDKVFIQNPFSNNKNDYVYKTGDYGRILKDSNFELLGRLDHQVQIRGVRIEIEEIEGQLRLINNIKEAAVTDLMDSSGYKYLCAYLVLKEKTDTGGIRKTLLNHLPEVMMPSVFLVVDSLPRTISGKIDRKALPKPSSILKNNDEYIAPRNQKEEIMAAIWADILGINRIGITDNFFELGGHSLLATQVISRLREALSIELPIQALFEFPTVEELSEQIEMLKKENQVSILPILPTSRQENLPLSFAQERLWFFDQFAPNNPIYNISTAIGISGPIHFKALVESLDTVCNRHDILRTNFISKDGNPVQTIRLKTRLALPVVDLHNIKREHKHTEIIKIVNQESQYLFQLEIDALLRFMLISIEKGEYLAVLTMHHIISDGWSMRLFLDEVMMLYDQFSKGNGTAALPDLPIQYKDFVLWQRKWLSGDILKQQLSYWKQQLKKPLPVLDHFTDYPYPEVQDHSGCEERVLLDTEITSAMIKLGVESGTTLFMVVLAAFAALISRQTGHKDIIIGAPVANRNRKEIEKLIGFFVNVLVLRIDLSGDICFLDLLKRVRKVCLDAFDHQDIPFEKLVKELEPERNIKRNPLFDILFNFDVFTETNPSEDEASYSEQHTETMSKFAMTLYVNQFKERIGLRWVYQKRLFSPTRIKSFMEQYVHFLEQITTYPDKPIQFYSLLTPYSKKILPDPNEILPEPKVRPITQLIEFWATKTPDHIALSHHDLNLTYAGFLQNMKDLANVLQTEGVKKGEVVAIFLPKSIGLIVSMGGTLLGGGVLLLIDQDLPVFRRRVMIEEAGAKYIIYSDSLTNEDNETIPRSLKGIKINATTGRPINNACNTTRNLTPPELTSDDAACIFYTSGTTGVPKGILGLHKGISHFIEWQRKTYEIETNDRSGQLTGLSFDVVIRDIFLPLSSGSTLCLPAGETALEPTAVLNWLEKEKISVLHTVPSLAQSWLIRVPEKISLSSLRRLFFAGEPLTKAIIDKWRRYFPKGGEIINLYGPTETSLAKCYFKVPKEVRKGIQPVGFSLPSTQTLLINKNQDLCGIWEPGEIVIRTPFRSMGYINNPEENNLKFIQNPYRNDKNDIFYFTGDLGRYGSDGGVEIMGRMDDQIKIRGVRVEPREVESILINHPDILNAAVKDFEFQNGKRIFAYYVTNNEKLGSKELYLYLQKRLPGYMIPSGFIMVEKLLLTPNGKIDKNALPRPKRLSENPEHIYLAPQTTTEEIIATIWSEILDIEKIGIRDNFFELGGHSLLATQVISQIRDIFSIDVPVRILFEAPIIEDLSIQVEKLKYKNYSLSKISPAPRNKAYPLSFAQERLWFLDQLVPENSFYNLQRNIHIKGYLNVDALNNSLSEILKRHEVLRTNFHTLNGRPVQVFSSDYNICLSIFDLQNLEKENQEIEVQRLAQQEYLLPFDLKKDQLLRVKILLLSREDQMLILTMHHIISDGWSRGIFAKELLLLYNAFSKGEASPLPELAIQYADFAHWQREWLKGAELDHQLKFWRNHLGDAKGKLELPLDYPRPAVQTFNGGTVSVGLEPGLRNELIRLGRKKNATLFMTMYAAFATLLYRYSGQEEIIVGTPIANRNRPEIEGLIGFFVNTLALCTTFSDELGFNHLMDQVREMMIGAYDHQDLPFEKLVEELQPDRDLSRNPLVQVLFALQNLPHQTQVPETIPQDLTLNAIGFENVTVRQDLEVYLWEGEDGMGAYFVYNKDLFEQATIIRMARHYKLLLERIVEDPDQVVSQIPLLDEEEKETLQVKWNDTKGDYGEHDTVHQGFEACTLKNPDTIGLVFEDQSFSYKELNEQANQLARYLNRHGMGQGELVGLCVHRSPDMVVALLGILKSGAAYVPLDPTYPKERISLMIEDSNLSMLLTQESLVQELSGMETGDKLKMVCLDKDWKEIEFESRENPANPVGRDDMAYVIYTSGSTGRPKGVVICHGAVVNFLISMGDEPGLSQKDVLVAVTTISFDIAVLEIFLPLLKGAKITLLSRDVSLDGTELINQLDESGATVLQATPATYRMLLASGWRKSRGLKVLCGGEALAVKLSKELLGKCDSVWNVYGPTETTIWSSAYEVTGKEIHQSVESIGTPILNTQFYILDNRFEMVPVGVYGELFIGGDGLSMGYFNRPDLTHEKFIPNPFSEEKGSRLYRTGDVARYLKDGNIEFLGRMDHQVKIRGYRIELGDIESALSKHPGVKETVVMVREDEGFDKRLVAYLVPKEEMQPEPIELRNYLKGILPEYMVPQYFVIMDVLPLTPNGKINRKQLPQPDDSFIEKTYAAPETQTQEIVASIWAKVLKVERMGIHDDFFEIGGHSLLATQVISRIRDAFTVDLSIRSLFEKHTVYELSEVIDQMNKEETGDTQHPIQRVDRDGDLPLSFAQERLWFLDQLMPENPFYNMSTVLHVQGGIDFDALNKSLSAIVHRHEVFRTHYEAHNGLPVQVINPEIEMTCPIVEAMEDERKIRALISKEVNKPFNLQSDPLLRALCLKITPKDHILILTTHHIVSDGWSKEIFTKEMFTLYNAFSKGDPSPLPELPIQYADFAFWQREWLTGEALDHQLAFWRNHLGDAKGKLELPLDYPRPAVQTFNGGTVSVGLEPGLRNELTRLGQQKNATLFMTMYAAFATLLYRYSGQEEIIVGTPIANRNRPEIEGLIGFFVNTLALCTTFSDELSFNHLMDQVREMMIGAYDHQDLPFEKLVEELQPDRDLSRNPLVQVLFALQNLPHQTQVPDTIPSDLTLDSVGIENVTVRQDLEVYLWEGEDGMGAYFVYNKDLFEQATIIRMARHYKLLLERIVEDPDQVVSQIPLLDEEEKETLQVKWNDTKGDYGEHDIVHQGFEACTLKNPDTIGLVFEDQSFSYKELNEQANQLARYLNRHGMGQGELVGLCVHRSPDMVVALLGILKSGAAYVPLDPTYPKERISLMIEDSNLSMLLTQESLVQELSGMETGDKLKMVCLDKDWKEIEFESRENPANPVGRDDMAYVIYTSGSTGRPKGVVICHGAVVNFLISMGDEPGLSQKDVLVAVTTISFDIAVLEIFLPLLKGAKITLLSRDVSLDGTELINQLDESGATVLQATPATYRMLLASGWRKSRGLKVLCGGEALAVKLSKELLGKCDSVWNVYGPTETTIWSSAYEVTGKEIHQSVESIGTPILNTQFYILDNRFEMVPVGVYGELFIGGDGLSMGYFNRPDLTHEKFIPNPFSEEKGARLYRTGDVARYLKDGNIEFLGRMDHQVKIRGYRIELGDIESALSKHPGVKETVVMVREDEGFDKRLVAYLVPKGEIQPEPIELRNYLKEILPEYMVPQYFVIMDVLPLTPNGKINRKQLPQPNDSFIEKTYAAPETQTQEIVASIWAKVLKVERVGIHDDFFEIGGHSLLATQVISRIRDAFTVDLSIRSLFEKHTVYELSEDIDQMHKEEKGDTHPIQRVERDKDLPLSFAQERLWFLDQITPENPFYNIPLSLYIPGELDTYVLSRSFNEIFRRHEVLRTNFIENQGLPVQIVSNDLNMNQWHLDIQQLSDEDKIKEIKRLTREEAKQPFNLAEDQLIRPTLIKMGKNQHYLLLTMHHIISDGWSLDLFQREMAAIYDAFEKGEPSPLAELPVQYLDFVSWQRKWLTGDVLDKQLTYWKKQLRNPLPVLDLFTDYPYPEVQKISGGEERILIDTDLSSAIKKLSLQSGTTVFMVILAAFSTILSRQTAQEDIIIGAPVANRNRKEIEALIGFFVNVLVLRIDLSGDIRFTELLERVRKICIEAYSNQDIPFEKLVKELEPERNLNRNPLFDVMYNFDVHSDSAPSENKDSVSIKNDEVISRFAMTLYADQFKDNIRLRLVYQRSLFSAERITEFLEQLKYLLQQISDYPEISIKSHSLITPDFNSKLPDLNEMLPEPEYRPITRLLEYWSNQIPDHKAICQDNLHLTYAELFKNMTDLVNILQTEGLSKGDVVAIFLPKSIGLVVSMGGILLSGGVLLLVDQDLPLLRRQIMISEANAKYLIYADSITKDDETLFNSLKRIKIDADTGEAVSEYRIENKNDPPELSPEDAAYIFYTSGTTGIPKGILGLHKGISHFLDWQRDTFKIEPKDRSAQLTGLSFDVVIRDIFLPLSSGATLCLPTKEIISEPEEILKWLEKEKISVLHTVPSLVQSWLTTVPKNISLSTIRWVFFAGEPLTKAIVEQWRSYFPGTGALINLYGPAETTLAKCCFKVPEKVRKEIQPIGFPLPYTETLVLNENQGLCGVSEPGEIVIRTPFRTKGYINNSHEHQQKFIQNPFRNDENDLLYYTGDIGRYSFDGSIEIIGRKDDQIKIRGIRIEPKEVESILIRHPHILHVAVLACEFNGEKRLFAYFVSNKDRLDSNELFLYLQKRVPGYMIPMGFIPVGKIPLTPNGKIDKQALPIPANIQSNKRYLAPRTSTEEIIALIWSKILGIEKIGIQDNFFELGGHSLLATQVISRIRKVFTMDLSIRSLFEKSTVYELSKAIDQMRPERKTSTHPIQRVPRNEHSPLSFAQERLWFLDQLMPENPFYNISITLFIQGELDIHALSNSFTEMLRRHEILRANIIEIKGVPLQVISNDSDMRLSRIDLQYLPHEEKIVEVRRLANEEAKQYFNLAKDRLIRATLLKLEENEHLLLITMHHIVSDGWSLGIFQRDMATIYGALSKGTLSPLAELPIQYADFASWQREWLTGEILEQQLNYWRRQLVKPLPKLELPFDRKPGNNQTTAGGNEYFEIDLELSQQIKELCMESNTTLYMTLLASFATLLSLYSGQKDIIIGTPIAGRNRKEIEPLIGFFVNTLVLRLDLTNDPTFLELLRQVQKVTLEAYANQDIPFERLVEELQPERTMGTIPLVQVRFTFQNLPMKEIQLEDLSITPLGNDSNTSKFDLTLEMREAEGILRGAFNYNTSLFEAETITDMMGHLKNLLKNIVDNKNKPLSGLQIDSPEVINDLIGSFINEP